MATITYEDVIPALIENTIMQKGFLNGVARVYTIKPASGYVIHDRDNDYNTQDPVTGDTVLVRIYQRGTVSCSVNYDFVANPREFYAVPESSVPADHIFGIGNNNHEVM